MLNYQTGDLLLSQEWKYSQNDPMTGEIDPYQDLEIRYLKILEIPYGTLFIVIDETENFIRCLCSNGLFWLRNDSFTNVSLG